MLTTQSYNTAVVQGLLRVAVGFFPSEAGVRVAAQERERASASHTLPVFVCGLTLPFSLCPLHIFEPRYRLMVRKVVQDGSRSFGMLPHDPTAPGGYPDYGVTVRVKRVRLLPDGRSFVDCVGENRRFKVSTRDVSEGGYNVCTVEWLRDEDEGVELEGEGGRTPSLEFLEHFVSRLLQAPLYNSPEELRTGLEGGGLEVVAQDRLFEAFLGCRAVASILRNTLPPCPPLSPQTAQQWLWWIASALPCSDAVKYTWLRSPSWRDRAESMASYIQQSAIATPLDFFLCVGAMVGRGQHCGIQ